METDVGPGLGRPGSTRRAKSRQGVEAKQAQAEAAGTERRTTATAYRILQGFNVPLFTEE